MNLNERLIRIFREQAGGYVSGERLSRELNVTRTAIWKHIRELREMGYAFDAVPKLGYRLTEAPDRWDASDLLNRLQTDKLGRRLHLFDTLESTQNKAHELVRKGAPEGTLVIADRQTEGRGRMGRRWHSPKGKGIWMSLVLKPEIPVQFVAQFTLLVAVSVYRAIRKVVPEVEPGIKWPNDLLIGGRKVCGILLESSATDETLNYVVAGVGISVNLAADDFPEELRPIATSLLIESGRKVERAEMVAQWLRQLEELYKLFMDQGFAPIRTLWEAASATLGNCIRVQTPSGLVEGEAVGLDESGALLVKRPDGRTVTVYSGHFYV